jgi:hypothetical protein
MAGMKPEIKAQWLADLRSDKFPQINGRLSDGEGYCCLGVLCEQAVKAGVVTKTKTAYGAVYGNDDSRSEAVLPRAVLEWAGLEDADPTVTLVVEDEDYGPEETTVGLSEANDDYGKTFRAIADLIDEQL